MQNIKTTNPKLLKYCLYCKKEFIIKKFDYRQKYCSKKCAYVGKIGVSMKNFTLEQKIERIKHNFNKHVIRKDGCWGWNGSTLKGYGRFNYRDKSILATRGSWLIHFGDIPDGLYVLHKCDNPICSNPEHLFLGTAKDNMQDKIQKGRDAIGERNGSSKLTNKKVLKIRDLFLHGVTYKEIMKEFNVAENTIYCIKSRKTWRHI